MNGRKKGTKTPDAQIQKKSHELSQYAAILTFIGLAVLLCVSARYGLQNDDEITCVVGAHRMMLGELPMIKNWTLVQLHSFLEYLPFRLVYALSGGTEGIVLGIRYCYVAAKMLFFAVICFALRRYRYWAILCALIFTTFHPIDFQSLTYYNVSIMLAFAVGGLLFFRDRFSKRMQSALLILAGALLACCVLSEPPVILLYLLFSLSVPVYYVIKNKRGRRFSDAPLLPDVKTWGLLTIGAAAVAAVVFLVVLSAADLKTVLVNAPGVLRILAFHPQTNQWEKYADYFFKTGYAANAAALLTLAGIGIAKATRVMPKLRNFLFAAVCAVFLWMTVSLYCREGKILSVLYLPVYKPIPLCFLGLSSYLLAEKKHKRLFAFYLFGLAFAFSMDLLSRVSICTGAIVSVPAAVLLFRQALLEAFRRLRAGQRGAAKDKKQKKPSRNLAQNVVCAFAVLTLTVLTGTEIAYSFHARLYPSPEVMTRIPLSAKIERGPLKGLYTIPDLHDKYEAVLADMDRLREASPRALFVTDYCQWCNLYLDLPYATFSQDSYDSEKSRECLLYYWSLHPDARPDAVYIPFFGCDDYLDHTALAEDNLAYIQSICKCEMQPGEIGYILKILSWN